MAALQLAGLQAVACGSRRGARLPPSPHAAPAQPRAALGMSTGSASVCSHWEHGGTPQLLQPWHGHCSLLACVALPPAISRRKPLALTFGRRRSSPPAAQAPHPAWAAGAPQVGASSQSQGPCNLGGRGGCTCCSSYCFINTKNRQVFGNEFFCLCGLWHFLDTNKKVAN